MVPAGDDDAAKADALKELNEGLRREVLSRIHLCHDADGAACTHTAVWYATAQLHSLYTAAEHSISAFFGGFCGPLTATNGSLSGPLGMGLAPADCS